MCERGPGWEISDVQPLGSGGSHRCGRSSCLRMRRSPNGSLCSRTTGDKTPCWGHGLERPGWPGGSCRGGSFSILQVSASSPPGGEEPELCGGLWTQSWGPGLGKQEGRRVRCGNLPPPGALESEAQAHQATGGGSQTRRRGICSV